MAEIPSSPTGEVHALRVMLDGSRLVSACLQDRRRGGKLAHMCAVGRCGRQPWPLHGLSVHGSDASGTCWGSAQICEGDFFQTHRLECVVTGKVH